MKNMTSQASLENIKHIPSWNKTYWTPSLFSSWPQSHQTKALKGSLGYSMQKISSKRRCATDRHNALSKQRNIANLWLLKTAYRLFALYQQEHRLSWRRPTQVKKVFTRTPKWIRLRHGKDSLQKFRQIYEFHEAIWHSFPWLFREVSNGVKIRRLISSIETLV